MNRLSSLLLALAVSLAGQPFDESQLQGLRWRLVGPMRGGRVLAVAGIPADANTFYFGAAAGGVWKTTNGGESWVPLFDHQSVSSIGALALAPSNPNIIYVGTGEACIRGNISHGDGVYKSVDAGKTWINMGLRETRHIGRILVDPKNPDLVLVAALGHAYGPNTERGVFRSSDGGKTWQKVLYKDENTGAIDLSFDPANPEIVFAALWQVQRTPWSLTSGGPGSGIYKSVDAGKTWSRLDGHGLPVGPLGRIGISVSPADSTRIYAMIEANEGGLFRSDDGGGTWSRINGDYGLRGRPWYYTHVTADPVNADTVYILDFGFHRSIDGGRTFSMLFAPHGDYHALWIDPTNPRRMINANDGGASISTDWGKSWSSEDNQPTAQFYHVVTDNRFPYHLYGAQQDRGTVAIASRREPTEPEFYAVGGGESGMICPYPPDPNIVYAGSNYGTFTRFDKRTEALQNISPWPQNYLNMPAADAKYRFQWTTPMLISPHDPNILYIAAQVLFKTSDAGMTWTSISPDLTRNDKSKQKSSGGPISQDNTGVEYFDTIFALAESPLEKNLIWAGTDDGLIQLTRDGGKNWTNVTPASLPEWSMVSLIDASPHAAGTAYAAIDRHKLDDFRPYIFKTADYGHTWTRIDRGIPEDTYVHAVREDPKRKGLLYAGAETGIFVSFDDGAHWQSLQLNLPMSPVHDLVIHDDDLVAATYGRAFWILDDVSPLRQIGVETTSNNVKLFTPATAYRTRDNSAAIYYNLSAAPSQPVTIEIRDSKGKVVRSYRSRGGSQSASQQGGGFNAPLTAMPGLNRLQWNLRYGGQGGGPIVLPGSYEVRLVVDGQSYAAPLTVKLDPRVQTSAADLEKQLDLATRIRTRVSEVNGLAGQLESLKPQLDTLRQHAAQDSKARGLSDAVDDFKKKLALAEAGLIGWRANRNGYSLNYPPAPVDQLSQLASAIEGADAAPNQPSYQVFEELSRGLDPRVASARELLTKDLAALNDLARKANVGVLTPAAGAGN
jgi:photosystem II stability/assembly factor-like uncharacterized protein